MVTASPLRGAQAEGMVMGAPDQGLVEPLRQATASPFDNLVGVMSGGGGGGGAGVGPGGGGAGVGVVPSSAMGGVVGGGYYGGGSGGAGQSYYGKSLSSSLSANLTHNSEELTHTHTDAM